MLDRFDALCQRFEAGYSNVPEPEGLDLSMQAEIIEPRHAEEPRPREAADELVLDRPHA